MKKTPAATVENRLPNKLLLNAVEATKKEYCQDFFRDRKPTPNRLFARYYSEQDEATFVSFGMTDKPGDNYYYQDTVPISSIRCDEALTNQDRRDLESTMLRASTMLSFVGNGEDLDTPAVVLRKSQDDTYQLGGGRHRTVMSVALGCVNVNAWVVVCTDETWEDLRRKLNVMNGAELTTEERIRVVHEKVKPGGNGSIKHLCQHYGISNTAYQKYALTVRTAEEAEKKGLVPKSAPAVVVAAVVRASEDKKISIQKAQEIIDAASPVNINKPPAPTKTLDRLIKPLTSNGAVTEEEVAELITGVKSATATAHVKGGGQRGPNKGYALKLREGVEMAVKATKSGSGAEIGLAMKEALILLAKVEGLVNWLRLASEPKKN